MSHGNGDGNGCELPPVHELMEFMEDATLDDAVRDVFGPAFPIRHDVPYLAGCVLGALPPDLPGHALIATAGFCPTCWMAEDRHVIVTPFIVSADHLEAIRDQCIELLVMLANSRQ
jgi:hypothetical protein